MSETWEGLWIGMGGIATRSMKVMADMLGKLVTALGPVGATLKPIVENVANIGLDKMSETFEANIGAKLSDADVAKRQRLSDTQRKLAEAQARLSGLSGDANAPQQWNQQPQEMEQWIQQSPTEADDYAAMFADEMAGRFQSSQFEDDMMGPTPVEISEDDRAAIWDAPVEANKAGAIPSNLTTYSAAAAQAAGFGGGGTPEDKMVESMFSMRKTLEQLGLMTKEQTASNAYVAAMHERFLAAFQYG
jgi:hypothetical protein